MWFPDELRGTYNNNSQIRFKTSMLRSRLCDYSDAYILVKGTTTVANTDVAEVAGKNGDKKVIFKNCASLTSCISRMNNTEIDDAQYIYVVMPMHNLIEYSDNYSKKSGILWQFCRDVPAVNDDGEITAFSESNADTNSFKIKENITDQTDSKGKKDVEIMVPLKYLS